VNLISDNPKVEAAFLAIRRVNDLLVPFTQGEISVEELAAAIEASDVAAQHAIEELEQAGTA